MKNDKMMSSVGILIPLVVGIGLVIGSLIVLAYKLTTRTSYYEKWKDYDDCGLA